MPMLRYLRTAGFIYSLLKNPIVFAKRGLQIPAFPNLFKEDIKAIPDYFDSIPNKKN
jgi:hypothetical protein